MKTKGTLSTVQFKDIPPGGYFQMIVNSENVCGIKTDKNDNSAISVKDGKEFFTFLDQQVIYYPNATIIPENYNSD